MTDSGNLASADAGDELSIDFGRAGNSAEYRRVGWSDPEPRHTWTIGQESTLEFPRPVLPGDYKLVLDVGPFLWQDRLPAQHLVVSVNGREVGNFTIKEIARVECSVPWRLIERNDWVSVTLSHPDAARPIDVNRVPDDREIALAFETVSFVKDADSEAVSQNRTTTADRPAQLPVDQLMMQFESLGENCEFGLAQRRCHAEPLGLLRFASTPLSALLAALKQRFEGLGEPDQVEVRVSDNKLEYLVLDRRYGILYHPWLLVGQAEAEEIRQRELKRLPLLKRKLLEDLEEGSKIFVYRGMRPLSRALVRRLVDALREHGPGMLLWVELHDAAHPPGTVEMLGDGLLKGYIDRFAPGDNAHDLSIACWVELCRNALAVARDAKATD
jgi:hypothetical protein